MAPGAAHSAADAFRYLKGALFDKADDVAKHAVKTAKPHAVGVAETSNFADEAAKILEDSAAKRGLTRNALQASIIASNKLKAGETVIGFVDRYGKQIGPLFQGSANHADAALQTVGLAQRVKAGDAFAVTLGKDAAGKVWSYGMNLPKHLMDVIPKLVE